MSEINPTADHGFVDAQEPDASLEDNIKSRSTWLRLLFMLICCVLVNLAAIVGSAVVVLGFFWVLFTGRVNPQLRGVGQSLAAYIYEVVRYLTYNSDDKPFPLGGEWPSGTEG